MHQVIRTILIILFCISPGLAGAIEIKYGFKTGNIYEYELSRQDSSKSSAFNVDSSRNNPKTAVNFAIKAIDFQDGAYILDIGNKDATYRRYISENGEIKGAPGETGQNIPFFLTFPKGDWKVGEKHQLKKELNIGNRAVPVVWNLLLKSVDNEKELAEILFSVTMQLPEDLLRQKEFNLKGRASFNMSEGVLQNAEWASSYGFNFSNKEMAVTRGLWKFTRQANGFLSLKGIKEQQ